MMIWGLALMAMLVMKLWPETPAGRWLHECLVERPVELASKIKRRHIIFLIIGLAVMYAFAEIGMPHLGVVMALDVSAYVDILITAMTVAAVARTRGGWAALRARFTRSTAVRKAPRPRSRRTRTIVRRPASNDDDGHGDYALAA